MTNGATEPSQLAIERLLTRIEADENIPVSIKQVLSIAIPTGDLEQIDALRASLAEWAENDEDSEHPAE